MSLLRRLRHRLAVFARVGGSVVHASGTIAHYGLTTANDARECPFQFNLVSLGCKLVAHFLRNAVFHHHVASAKGMLAETWGFQRRLNVHLEIREIGDELRVRLRLVPTSHDSERHPAVAFLS